MKHCILIISSFLLSAWNCAADATLAERTETALSKASSYFQSISTRGGYVGTYSLDLKERYGESLRERAKATEIWVQPPGTPSVGECFLRAYRITGKQQYLTAATEAARALAFGQRTVGGWDHLVDVAHLQKGSGKASRMDGRCTFDDNTTQGALSFLMSLDETVDSPWLSEAVELGLAHMMKSQFGNGAWSQWYPLIGGYHDYYTFNDKTMNDCIKVMLKAHRIYGKEEYLSSAKRGGDFIILSQLAPPQSGWAQQYSHDLKPAWARRFEPPGVCCAATGNNIRTLVDLYLYTKDAKYLEPIPRAIEWLEKSKIGDNLWPRLYEVGSNRPIYGDRMDGDKIFYVYEDISERERTSYGWRGDFGIRGAISYYEKVKSMGTAGYTAKRDAPLTAADCRKKAKKLSSKVEKTIAALDDKGRWVEDGMIHSKVFVKNVNLLCSYLEYLNCSQQ
ncbi:MAG: pectate lyase [Kiritimatiellales bacterium]|nr:pectate lyase [Kiritimatiellales bacterium]